MEHVLNINAIKRKMKCKPTGQRLHHFFLGANTILTKEEIAELKKVIEQNHKKMQEYLDEAAKKPYHYAVQQ